jgi:DNA-directed RNA polymerase I subunit RPA49
VEFFSSEETKSASTGSRYATCSLCYLNYSFTKCRYYIAVHNRRTQKTTIRAAPLHILTTQVKAFKGLESSAATIKERVLARNALGETFGTKKAKAAIKSAERNKVDVSAMEGVISHLVDRIEQSTGALPSKGESFYNGFKILTLARIVDEMKEIADSNRLIPPFDPNATIPADVYKLHDIIPEIEWKALSVSSFMAATRDSERIALLPFRRSEWINHHLKLLFKNEDEKPSKRTMYPFPS